MVPTDEGDRECDDSEEEDERNKHTDADDDRPAELTVAESAVGDIGGTVQSVVAARGPGELQVIAASTSHCSQSSTQASQPK